MVKLDCYSYLNKSIEKHIESFEKFLFCLFFNIKDRYGQDLLGIHN